MNDFATEDFLNKNIRVRPLSGMSRGQPDEPVKNDAFGGAGDEDEKFN